MIRRTRLSDADVNDNVSENLFSSFSSSFPRRVVLGVLPLLLRVRHPQ